MLDKLQDVRGLEALRAEQERQYRAQEAEEQRRLREAAERRARETRKYKCPGCEKIIILTPEEYQHGLGYKVRPRNTYSCPYCDKPKPKGFFRRILDRFLA